MKSTDRTGLTSGELRRGRCYSLPGYIGPGYRTIRIEGIGPKMVRYRGWDVDQWSRVERHPRVLFDSWDGAWTETKSPEDE